MNIEDAAHRLAHEAKGGCEALAVRMGIGEKVFYGKVNPNDKGHVLGLVEALRMQQLTGRRDIVIAMCDALGGVFMPKTGLEQTEGDISTLLADTCAEFGDYLREIDKAMHDRQVTPNEIKRLQKELLELITAATRIQQRMADMAEQRSRRRD